MGDGAGIDAASWPVPGPPSGSGEGGTVPVTSSLQVIRPDDLLSLTFGLINLRSPAAASWRSRSRTG
jgi:hypothetical protein